MTDVDPDEVVEVGEEDEERDAIRAENARDYPADLPAGLEAATAAMAKSFSPAQRGVESIVQRGWRVARLLPRGRRRRW